MEVESLSSRKMNFMLKKLHEVKVKEAEANQVSSGKYKPL